MGRRVRERFARLVFLSELKLRPPEENSKGAGRRPAVRKTTAKNRQGCRRYVRQS